MESLNDQETMLNSGVQYQVTTGFDRMLQCYVHYMVVTVDMWIVVIG